MTQRLSLRSQTRPAPVLSSARPSVAARLVALLLALGLVGGCGVSGADIPQAVVEVFGSPDVMVADLTQGQGEPVPLSVLDVAAERARDAGTALRVVIVAPDAALVDPQALADHYGGTVLSYKSDDPTFEVASVDMTSGQLDRAIAAAARESDFGASAGAFVGVIEREGLNDGSIWRTIVLIALGVSVLFAISQLISYLRARRKARRRQASFNERKLVLRDWAVRLAPEVEAVEAQAHRLDRNSLNLLAEARVFVNAAVPVVESASSPGELDAAEIRIARAAIKMRDLRQRLQ